MNTDLIKARTSPPARMALVTESEEKSNAFIRELYHSKDEGVRSRAWAKLGPKEGAALFLLMLLTVEFEEKTVLALLEDLLACSKAGVRNPTIIVSQVAEGGAE